MKQNSLLVGLTLLPIAYLISGLDLTAVNIPISLSWLGTLLFTLALPLLATEIPACLRLRPLGFVLAAIGLFAWANDQLFGWFPYESPSIAWLFGTLVSLLLSVYFMYSLLSYLGEIATRYAYRAAPSFPVVRNSYAILSALSILPWFLPAAFLQKYFYILGVMVLLMIGLGIWILTLFIGLRQAVKHFDPTAKTKNVFPKMPPAENHAGGLK